MTELSINSQTSSAYDESFPMTSLFLHYEPVEGERLEFESDEPIYRNDDTAQIFGDDSRIPIGLKEILCDSRLNPSKKIFCCGAATSLSLILLVFLFFIIGGYFHVQNEITELTNIAKNGLQLLPELNSDGAWVMFLNLNKETEQYAAEIQKYITNYEKEQDSRSNYTRECKNEDRPNSRAWCRFPTKKRFIRAGKGCTNDDKYGYSNRTPCVLINFKDENGWVPKFSNKSLSVDYIPFKCNVLDTFKLYNEHIKISYYPAFDLNANYGAFSLNKIPAMAVIGKNNTEISDDYGETLLDQPTPLFVKFVLPSNFHHGVVHCSITPSQAGVELINLDEFKGNKEIRFDLIS